MKPLMICVVALCGLLLILGAVRLTESDAGRQEDRKAPSALGNNYVEGTIEAETASSEGRPESKQPDSGTASPVAGRVFRCSAADFAEETTESDEERVERTQRQFYSLIDSLGASSDLEHQMTSGILKVNGQLADAVEDFDRLLGAMPEDPVLHWRLLDACDVRRTYPLCESGEAEARVIRVLGSNGEAWAKIAHYRIKRGDEEGGLDALYNAASVAQFNDYWSSEVALLFRGLAIDTNRAVPARLVAAIGYVAAFPAPELGLTNQCRARAENSADWLRACLAYAKRKESDARTINGKFIGIGLQRAMYQQAGLPVEAAAALARAEPISAPLRDPAMRDGEVLLAYDESIAIAWLQRLTVYGGLSAMAFLESEVERVSQIPGYDPCPKPGPKM